MAAPSARYYGGKCRIAAELAASIAQSIKAGPPPRCYIEPFCGMLNVTAHMLQHLPQGAPVLLSDADMGVVSFWQQVLAGWVPTVRDVDTEAEWRAMRAAHSAAPTPESTFIGTSGGLLGSAFLGRCLDRRAHRAAQMRTRDFALDLAEALRQRRTLVLHRDFRELIAPQNSLIYCDPPYPGTMGAWGGVVRTGSSAIDEQFWHMAAGWAASGGNAVFISGVDTDNPEDTLIYASAARARSVLAEYGLALEEVWAQARRPVNSCFPFKPSESAAAMHAKRQERSEVLWRVRGPPPA